LAFCKIVIVIRKVFGKGTRDFGIRCIGASLIAYDSAVLDKRFIEPFLPDLFVEPRKSP
jgi:hypothetical protein